MSYTIFMYVPHSEISIRKIHYLNLFMRTPRTKKYNYTERRRRRKKCIRVHSHTNEQSVSVRNVHFIVSSFGTAKLIITITQPFHFVWDIFFSFACCFPVAATFAKCSVYIVYVLCTKLSARERERASKEWRNQKTKCTKQTTNAIHIQDTVDNAMLANVARFLCVCLPFVCLHYPFIS